MTEPLGDRVRRYLPVALAELVGPGGRVVGIDLNAAAVERARSVVGALGLDNVRRIAGLLAPGGIIADLEAAMGDADQWVSSPFFTDVIMRKHG